MKGISRPKYKSTVIHSDGDTADIVDTILGVDKSEKYATARSTEQYARTIPATYEGMEKLYWDVKDNIPYHLDPPGEQNIKTPSRTYTDGGDCKSLTIFITSVLQNLNVPYTIRFVSYEKGAPFRHVYPIAHLPTRDVILDTVHHTFDDEVKYLRKQDHKMTQIAVIEGFSEPFDITNHTTGDVVARLIGRTHYQSLLPFFTPNTHNQRAALEPMINVEGIGDIPLSAAVGGDIRTGAYYNGMPVSETNRPPAQTPQQQAANQAQYANAMQQAANADVTNWQNQLTSATAVIPSWVQQRGAEYVTKWREVINKFVQTDLQQIAPGLLGLFAVRTSNPAILAKAAKQRAWRAAVANAIGLHPDVITASVAMYFIQKYGQSPNTILAQVAAMQPVQRINGVTADTAASTLTNIATAIPKVEVVSTLVSTALQLVSSVMTLFQRDMRDIPTFAPDMVITAQDFGITALPSSVYMPTNIPSTGIPTTSPTPNFTPVTASSSPSSGMKTFALMLVGGIVLYNIFN
jgi:hypothetical protein